MTLQLAERGQEPTTPFAVGAGVLKPLRNPWRNRILFELHIQPMSPKEFAEAFRHLGSATVARYFRELKDWGFLEVAKEVRGGGRRGATEKVYRAVRQLHFDTETWGQLPRYLRSKCSAIALESLVIRLAEATQAKSIEADDRYIVTEVVELDRPAWEALVKRMDEVLAWLAHLEVEAGNRMMETGESPLHLTAALLAFRSPRGRVRRDYSRRQAGSSGPYFLMDPLMAKALSDPWRAQIMGELSTRSMSPRQFCEEFGGPELAATARYFRQLKSWGYLEVLEELRGGRRRGAIEKVYRGIPQQGFNTTAWDALPSSLTSQGDWAPLDGLIHRIDEAVATDTLDSELDRHASWLSLWLDRQAWEECLACLRRTHIWLSEIAEEAADRLKGSDRERISVTAALLGFRSPGVFPWVELEPPIGCTLDTKSFSALTDTRPVVQAD